MIELSRQDWTAVALSLRIAVVATLVSLPFGIAIATLLARRNFWGKTLVDAIIYLPLVLPPVVTGYLLLIAFGRRGLFGEALANIGIVYETDAKVEPKVKIIGTFPDDSYPPVTYPVAATANAKADAGKYLQFLRGNGAKAVFEKYGFSFLIKPVS